MKIGIIGAGNIGGNLTRRLTALGHDVSVANSQQRLQLSVIDKDCPLQCIAIFHEHRRVDLFFAERQG